jgi:hypothetical protein
MENEVVRAREGLQKLEIDQYFSTLAAVCDGVSKAPWIEVGSMSTEKYGIELPNEVPFIERTLSFEDARFICYARLGLPRALAMIQVLEDRVSELEDIISASLEDVA